MDNYHMKNCDWVRSIPASASALPLLLLAFVATAWAQMPLNRTPVDDAAFRQISDLFQYDRALPLEPVSFGEWPYRIPYIIEKVRFRSTHNELVPAYFARPPAVTGQRFPAVLLIHGSNGFWGKNEDWVLDWLDVLARSGRCVLVIDNYGFGERMRPGDEGIDGEKLRPYEERDMVVQTVTDQRRGIDYLLKRPEVDPKKIGILGGSRGGWIGAMVAGLDDRLAAVVLTVTAHSTGATDDPQVRYRHTLNFLPRIAAPVLLVNGRRDKQARVEFAKEMFALIRAPKREVWYDSEHYLPPKNSNKEALEWFEQYLK